MAGQGLNFHLDFDNRIVLVKIQRGLLLPQEFILPFAGIKMLAGEILKFEGQFEVGGPQAVTSPPPPAAGAPKQPEVTKHGEIIADPAPPDRPSKLVVNG